ncbi:alpha/beta fold hydrolase [Sphingomonas sp.]|uniref:alpha/beta hydrolase n=1 Tax=Sphingomonas sp. TaxID=28214 RepID=UPI001B2045A6|nr:alpha/beta fold hydrolase [Sphingomonas sp.]MBO9711934.1 alpha/beta fold hydrolase [Sphingomonas sp.]
MRKRWYGFGALGLAALVLAGAWAFGEMTVRPTMAEVAPADPPARDFKLTASDGVSIAATYRPGRRPDAPGVLILHGNGASRGSVARNAEWLARQGYAVLTIDFRGHGQSSPHRKSFGLFESRDAAAAFAWLKQRQRGAKVAVIGISLGGAASLLGDAGPLPADALVLQAVYPDIRHAIRNRIAAIAGGFAGWAGEPLLSYQSLPRYGVWPARISPLEALRRYHGPVLVIGGGADRYTLPEETRAMLDAAPGPKSLWLVPGLDHRGISATGTPDYGARLLRFLSGTIGVA